MCVLLVVATVSGSVLGGAVNCINGAVSPRFFRSHELVWEHTSVWLSAVVQGVVEGAADGAIFGVVFLIVLWLVKQGRCPLMTCYRSIRIAILLSLALWVMGGCCGVACATLLPQFRARTYFGFHGEWWSLARYAWVFGSYWAVTCGGPLVVVAVALRASASATASASDMSAMTCAVAPNSGPLQ
jgi:hypothetical protein